MHHSHDTKCWNTETTSGVLVLEAGGRHGWHMFSLFVFLLENENYKEVHNTYSTEYQYCVSNEWYSTDTGSQSIRYTSMESHVREILVSHKGIAYIKFMQI